jgi:hypothetical protein
MVGAVVLILGLGFPASAGAAAGRAPVPGVSTPASSGKTGGKGPARATFGIAPSTPGATDGRTYFGYRLGPGVKRTDFVAVVNYAAKPITLTVGVADLGNNADGSLAVGADKASATDAGSWITIKHAPQITVPAQSNKGPGRIEIPFAITVPVKVTPGDHGAALFATLTTTSTGKGANVELNQRVGARVLIRVPGPLTPGIVIRDLSASYSQSWNPIHAGTAQVKYTIVNTGNVILGAKQSVSISGWFGTHVTAPAKSAPEIPLLLPGKSATLSYAVNGVWPAFRQSLKVTVTPLVQPSDTATVHVSPVSASTTFWAIPLVLIAIFVLVVLLVVGTWWWGRRRGHNAGAPPPPGEPKAKELQPTG